MQKSELKNIQSPFSIDYWKSFKEISKWKIDKVIVDNKTNRITKLEIYNYFNIDDLEALIKYINTKKFKYTNDKKQFPPYWNILLSQRWKNINGQGKILNLEDKFYKYFYFVNFIKILVHRNRKLMLKIYHNRAQNKKFVKLEITYSYFKKKDKYNMHLLDWLGALKGMNEVIRKIEHRFTSIWFNEDFSKKITFDGLIGKIVCWKAPFFILNFFHKSTKKWMK